MSAMAHSCPRQHLSHTSSPTSPALLQVCLPSCSLTVAYLLLARGHDCRLHCPVTLYSLRQKDCVRVLAQNSEIKLPEQACGYVANMSPYQQRTHTLHTVTQSCVKAGRVINARLLHFKGAELIIDNLPDYLKEKKTA